MKIEISNDAHELLPDVFNLAFGPVDTNGEIDEIFGLKYYVRITRFGKMQYEDPFDFDDVLPYADRIRKRTAVPASKMYNYFIFKLSKKYKKKPVSSRR